MSKLARIELVRSQFVGATLILAAHVGLPIQASAEPNGIVNFSAVQSKRSFVSINAAAARGDSEAMYLLAMLHIEGIIPKSDYDEGIHWLKKSAAKGNKDAERMYSFMDNAFSGEGC